MKESYEEDVADHFGLDPYADVGDNVGVASVRGTGRRDIELRNQPFRVQTLSNQRECNTTHAVLARRGSARRSRRTPACLKTFHARTGRSFWFPIRSDDVSFLMGTVRQLQWRYR